MNAQSIRRDFAQLRNRLMQTTKRRVARAKTEQAKALSNDIAEKLPDADVRVTPVNGRILVDIEAVALMQRLEREVDTAFGNASFDFNRQ